MKALKPTVSLSLLLAAVSSPAAAQSNYHPHPLGIRTAGMGGAAAAFGTDSAMPFLNPAGIAGNKGYWLALSANVAAYNSFSVENYYSLDEAFDFDVEETPLTGVGLDIFPSSALVGLPLDAEGTHFFAISTIVPYGHSAQSIFGLELDPDPALNLRLLDEEDARALFYHVGPTYAVKLDDKLRAGVSIFARFVSFDADTSLETSSYDLNTGDVTFSPTEIRLRAQSQDLVITSGVQVGPFSGFSFGASLRTPSIHLSGSSRQDSRSFGGSSTSDQNQRTNVVEIDEVTLEGSDWRSRTPLSFTLGAGFEDPGTFAIAADVSFFLPVGPYVYSEGFMDRLELADGRPAMLVREEFSFEEEKAAVVNVNLGAEVALSDSFLLRGGFYTDFSNRSIPEERTSADLGTASIDRFGATLGLAYAGQRTNLQLGVIYRRETGHRVGWVIGAEPDYPDRAHSGDGVLLAFSGELDASTLLSLAEAVARQDGEAALAAIGTPTAVPLAPPIPPPPPAAQPVPVVYAPPPVKTATAIAPVLTDGATWRWKTATIAVTWMGEGSPSEVRAVIGGLRETLDARGPATEAARLPTAGADFSAAASRARADGFGYLLSISISRQLVRTEVRARLLDCANSRVEMDARTVFEGAEPSPEALGKTIAAQLLERLDSWPR